MVFVQAKNVKYTNDGVNERPNISFKYRLVQNGGVQVHGLYLLYGQNECQVSWATLNEAVKIQGTHANDVAGEVIRRIESRGGALNQQLLNDSIIVRE
ncbi:hypothetical protein BDV93DRAFT_292703 [Ceratobasidium sp. AG-I]|nr:hypothetical protein BDV93DRAFT_292703 [Ceratobasidium sp. AG-I]